MRDILDKTLPVDETGNLDGAFWHYSIPGLGIRYYGFETPKRASLAAKGGNDRYHFDGTTTGQVGLAAEQRLFEEVPRAFWLNGCPKCGGDLYKQADQFGQYIACLQCGRHLIPDIPIDLLTPLAEVLDGPASKEAEEATV